MLACAAVYFVPSLRWRAHIVTLHALGRIPDVEWANDLAKLAKTEHPPVDEPAVHPAGRDYLVQDAKHEREIGVRLRGDPLIGEIAGFSAVGGTLAPPPTDACSIHLTPSGPVGTSDPKSEDSLWRDSWMVVRAR